MATKSKRIGTSVWLHIQWCVIKLIPLRYSCIAEWFSLGAATVALLHFEMLTWYEIGVAEPRNINRVQI